jgi:predicted RNA binding protein YcfA (HicA-like mRNA interferase family)
MNWNLNSKQVIRALKKNGWYKVNSEGSHLQFKHPAKPGKVTIPHPKESFSRKMIKSIMKQSGIKDF